MITTDIQFGRRYRDTVTGWEGIATAYTKWMNGCVRWHLEALDKDGKPAEEWFDSQQIEEVVSAELSGGHEVRPPATGGPPTGRSETG